MADVEPTTENPSGNIANEPLNRQGAGEKIWAFLSRDIGPLPVGVWLLVIPAGILVAHYIPQWFGNITGNSSTTNTDTTSGTSDASGTSGGSNTPIPITGNGAGQPFGLIPSPGSQSYQVAPIVGGVFNPWAQVVGKPAFVVRPGYDPFPLPGSTAVSVAQKNGIPLARLANRG